MNRGVETLARLAARWAHAGPPIVVFNKSHSGSRLLARLLAADGVFLGEDRNESEDAHDILRLVRPFVERYYPDYSRLMRDGDDELEPIVESVLAYHLSGWRAGQRWGWKLCETLYVLPIVDRIFPGALYVHLIRDGRDVAFSDHVAPVEPFWRKVYFDTADLDSWRGRRLTGRAYRRASHIFNARHWVNSVTVGRHYGAMAGERYIEIRYEDLVEQPEKTGRRLLGALGLPVGEAAITMLRTEANRDSVGKYKLQPWRKRSQALAVLQPTLEAFGYHEPGEGLFRRLLRRQASA